MEENITFRLEKPENHRFVENMVREAFWNVYRPGFLEHFEPTADMNDIEAKVAKLL